MNHRLAVLLIGCIVLFGVDTSAQYRGRCVAQSASKRVATSTEKRGVSLQVGAERIGLYLPLIKDKRIGIVSNHTGRVGNSGTLLADTLLSLGQNVVKLYSPEHGYRGTDDAGASVADGKDTPTGLPVVSLYGKHRKPSRKDLADIDILLFDLQDVGARFYTYISTLHYVMEAAAEAGIPLIVLDRPNPCDHVAGPVLEKDCASFIGMHRIPLLHGLTMGELARMINEEGWLEPASLRCDLTIIRMKGWRHGDAYSLPIPPSPNLKSDKAVALYPSLCLFEATIMSVGRGTSDPFTAIGYPDKRFGKPIFTPVAMPGASNPKHKGKRCYGEVFTPESLDACGFDLAPFIRFYRKASQAGFQLVDRKRTFELLVGNKQTLKQIESGMSAEQISATWEPSLKGYRALRSRYLLYPER